MTQMALSMTYPSTRRAGRPAGAPGSRWRLRGAEFTAALVVTLGTGPGAVRRAARLIDRGVVTTAAAPGAVVVGPDTRLIAVQPSITSW